MKKTDYKNHIKAFLQVIEKESLLQAVLEFRNLVENIQTVPELFNYLSSSKVDLAKKKQALVILKSKNEMVVNTILLMIKDKKLSKPKEVINYLQEEVMKINNSQEVFVDTVVELKKNQKKLLQQLLEEKLDKKIILTEKINPDLLGGLKITIKDKVIDNTISDKIITLRQKINNNEY